MAKRLTRRRFLAACSSLAIAFTGCDGVFPTPKKTTSTNVMPQPVTRGTSIRLQQVNLSSHSPSRDLLQMVNFRKGDSTSDLSIYERSFIFEKLLNIDPRNSNLTPALADQVEWIDPLTFNFGLTPDRQFHSIDEADGYKITGRSIVDNAERGLQENIFLWNRVVSEVNTFTHTDSMKEHVVMRLNGIYANFFDDLASKEGEIKSPQLYIGSSEMVGSGPFIPNFDSSSRRYLQRNDRYAESRSINVAEIHFGSDTSSETLINHQATPEIMISTDGTETFRSDSSTLVHRAGTGQWYLGLRLDTDRLNDIASPTKLMSDQRIRIAIARSVNSDTISRHVNGRKPTLIAGPYSADILSREEIEENENITFDPSEAKRLALGANYQGQPLRMLHQNIDLDTSVAELIQRQLRSSGFNVELKPTSPELFTEDLDTREYEMALLYLEGFRNANQALKVFAHDDRDTRFSNYWAFSSTEVNAILAKANACLLPWERTHFHLEAQRRLLDLGPALIPLASTNQTIRKPASLTNYYHDAYNFNESVLSRFWRVNRNA